MNTFSLTEAWRASRLNEVPFKVGGFVALIATLGLALAGLGGGLSAAFGVGLGAATYGAVSYWTDRRVRHARAALKQIRAHQFEELESKATPQGDALNRLIWEIYRTGQQLDREIRELERMEHYRREFIGNVSHELKTPIFSVQGFAETLLDGALEDPNVNRSFVEKILRNVSRLDNLAQDLSAISRMETGEIDMRMAPFDVRVLLEEVAESLEMKAQEKDIALTMEAPADLPAVRGDRDRLRQVVVNLTDNAIKYTEAGGHVEIGAAQQDEGVAIRVADDGIGIAPDHIERLTERFYRVDRSRSRNQGGTGLGLAIVKHILSAHDRVLDIESTPGEGSTFSFALPAAHRQPA